MPIKILKTGLLILIPLGLILILEFGFRMAGFEPWNPEEKNISIDPQTSFFQLDSMLGFKTRHGMFQFTHDDVFTWQTTNRTDGLRTTSALWTPDSLITKSQIWFMGGSFTYGWSVNDEETFSWQVQDAFPELEIVNFGIPGFGTLQSYLQLKQALQKGTKPDMLILVYASFHDQRNVSSRGWRKTLAPYNQLGPLKHPKASIGDSFLVVEYPDFKYAPWPLMECSALIHFIEGRVNRLEENVADTKKVTLELILEMHRLCLESDTEFALATIMGDPSTKATAEHFEALGISVFDITVDTRLPEHNNLPYDSHPSAKAHKSYAHKIIKELNKR